MILIKEEIINLPVYTQSNQHLGKVVDIEISTQTQAIETYIVRSGLMISGILQPELRISPSQVITINNKKMVVEDTLTLEQVLNKAETTA